MLRWLHPFPSVFEMKHYLFRLQNELGHSCRSVVFQFDMQDDVCPNVAHWQSLHCCLQGIHEPCLALL